MNNASIHDNVIDDEKKFLSFINESTYGYIEFGLEGNVTFANKSAISLSGYRVEDNINFKDIIIEEDLQRAINDMNLVLEEPNAGPREYRVKRKDGKIVDIEVDILPIREAGKVIGFQSTLLNISDRKRTESDVTKSEIRYRFILENMEDEYFELDLGGNITFFNRSLLEKSEITEAELKGLNYKFMMDPEEAARVYKEYNTIYKTGKPAKVEMEIYQTDKVEGVLEKRCIENSVQLMMDGDGKKIGFRGISRDVTDRKMYEREIRDKEFKYTRLFESLREGILVSDPDGKIEVANPAAAEMLGYEVAELIGQHVESIYADINRRKEVFEMLYEKNYLKDYEMPLKKKDGTLVYTKGSATLHRDKDGNVFKVEGIFSDITERVRIEKEIVKSEKIYRTLVESIKDMIFRGDIYGKIIFMNKAISRTIGYSEDELKSINWIKSVHPDDAVRVEKKYTELLEGEGIENFEIKYKIKDGSYIDISINVQPVFGFNAKVEGFTGVARDITVLKKAKQELKRSKNISEAYMEATTDAAVLIDIDGIIVDVNKEFGRRFSKDIKKLFGNIIFDLFPDEVAAQRKEMGRKVIESGKPLHIQEEREGRWNDATIYPLFDEDGNVSHMAIFAHDITDLKVNEEKLSESRNELEKKVLKRTIELEEVNTALRVLVKNKDADVEEIADRILFNINELIMPNLEGLKKTNINKHQSALIDIINKNLAEITSQFIDGLEGKYLNLTPSEMKIANLVKQGKTNKDIADMYNLSTRTVESHRDNIRRKIGIKNKQVNLRSYLMSANNT
ncbi:MAG: PAS domain S-box protein [Desulfobacterales bacterium]|nr:PAS domain S-box protein [Desulfobacterales bacterium]